MALGTHRVRWEAAILLAAVGVWSGLVLWPQFLAARTGSPAAAAVIAASQATAEPPPPPPWLLPGDDAYIFIRYAQQLARGLPLQWNRGEASTGASSFLFPVLLVPVQWLGGSLAAWSWWSLAVGLLGLWVLGVVGRTLLAELGLPRPWALGGALAVVWSGAIGFSARAGMETAWNAAALVGLSVLWRRAARLPPVPPEAASGPVWWSGGRSRASLLVLLALLPWIRPENLAITGVAAGLIAAGGLPGVARRHSLWLLLPAGASAVTFLLLTGSASPAGVAAKSWLAAPFMSGKLQLANYGVVLATQVAPVYLGLSPLLLAPPLGLLATATAAAAIRRGLGSTSSGLLAAAAPLAWLWAAQLALAPLSAFLFWQFMRHHQPGLVLAVLLAWTGLYGLADLAARRWPAAAPLARGRLLPLLLPALLLVSLPRWAAENLRITRDLAASHLPVASWLERHARDRVLLVNDAGLFALAHDGPIVDAVGLGTPALTRPFRHGVGATVEALARLRRVPTLAAIDSTLLPIAGLLGGPRWTLAGGKVVVAPLRADLLRSTAAGAAPPGLDFAFLGDEARSRVRWSRPPVAGGASFAALLPGAAGTPELEGCRPLYGAVRFDRPPGGPGVELVATSLTATPSRILVRAPADEKAGVSFQLPQGRWTHSQAVVMPSPELEIVRQGPGLPCLARLSSPAAARSPAAAGSPAGR